MTVQSEVIGTSTANRVTGSWFGQTGCPLAIGQVGARESWSFPLLPTFPSCEGKAWLPAGGRTASRGAVETGAKQELHGRDKLPTVLPLLIFSSLLCNKLSHQN